MNNANFNNFTNQDFAGLSNWLNSLNPYEFAIVGVIAGLLIAPALTANQQNSVGNFLEEIGQVLLVIAAQEITVQQANQNNNNTNQGTNNANNNLNSQNNSNYTKEINDLKKEIAELKQIINQKCN